MIGMDSFISDFLELNPGSNWTHLSIPVIISVLYLFSISIFNKKKEKPNDSNQYFSEIQKGFNLSVSIFAAILAISLGYQLSQYDSDNITAWCVPFGKEGITNQTRFWLNIYHFFRYYQLLETYFHILQQRKISSLHKIHHITMVWTSWLWTRCNLSLVPVLAWVNAIDNSILYFGYFLQDSGKRWKVILIHWTELEMALGYCFSGCYLYFQLIKTPRFACSGFLVFMMTSGIHAGVGLYLNMTRQNKVIGNRSQRK